MRLLKKKKKIIRFDLQKTWKQKSTDTICSLYWIYVHRNTLTGCVSTQSTDAMNKFTFWSSLSAL